MDYPYSSSLLLTDAVFLAYDGKTGTSSAFSRNAAYFIAEKEMSSHLHTLLQPTNVSGTYLWSMGNPFEMDWGYVHAINGVSVFDTQTNIRVYTPDELTRNVFIRNSKNGQIDIGSVVCPFYPYQVTVDYNAGLPTGTSLQPDMLWCLTQAAQLVLNEMSTDGFLANETPGGVGVQRFSNNDYSETRTTLGHSIFGASPIAQQIVRLTSNLRSRSVGRFRR